MSSDENLIQLKANALLQKEFQKIIQNKNGSQNFEPSNQTEQNKTETRFSECDKQFITKYAEKHTEYNQKQIVMYCTSHFRGQISRSDIQQFVKTISKESIDESQENEEQRVRHGIKENSATKRIQKQLNYKTQVEVYQKCLEEIVNEDLSDLKPKELCEQIDSLETADCEKFWKLVQQNSNQIQVEMLKYFHYKNFCRIARAPITNLKEQAHIYKFIEEQQKQTPMENLGEKYNITIRPQNKSQLEQLDNYTQIYKTCLTTLIGGDYSQYTPKQLCMTIDKLSIFQQINFWNQVQVHIPQIRDSKIIKHYYYNSYCRVLYTDNVSEEDRYFILNYISQNKQLSHNEQTEYLMQTYFKNRDIFPPQVTMCIKNYNQHYKHLDKNNTDK
ncbi:Conserved_hypothetical protein [Hexamita inflata]|uniref:Uncharacterized protein n=1 Tax=Hexamita inflata TaxID=28002 RepID=A0AA86RQR6_9EUKA|nr:Conserved hypothetical protein [Hexamita inflata]